MYTAYFTRQAVKSFKKIPKEYQLKLKDTISKLEEDPYSSGTIKLLYYPVTQYRKRTGDYRILFDIADEKKILIIAAIRRKTSTTYQ